MRKKLPEWMITPLFECPYCMSSVHGSGFFILFSVGLSVVYVAVFYSVPNGGKCDT